MAFNMSSSEPYSIVDNVSDKTVKQLIDLESAHKLLWELRGSGQNVRLVGDLRSSLEKRAWGE